MSLESSLRDNVQKVFKGLDEKDYAILKFFEEKGPASKYKASVQLKEVIPRATLYRRIDILKDKDFLTVVDSKQFIRGKLRSEVEILKCTIKGAFAVLGSEIDFKQVFKKPSKDIQNEPKLIKAISSYEKQLEFFNKVFGSLNAVNEDLTDKKSENLSTLIITPFLLKNPDYMAEILSKVGLPKDTTAFTKEFFKVIKILKELFESKEEGVES